VASGSAGHRVHTLSLLLVSEPSHHLIGPSCCWRGSPSVPVARRTRYGGSAAGAAAASRGPCCCLGAGPDSVLARGNLNCSRLLGGGARGLCRALLAGCPALSRHPRKLHAGADAELGEDMPQVGVDSVRGYVDAFGHLAIGSALSDEAHHREF